MNEEMPLKRFAFWSLGIVMAGLFMFLLLHAIVPAGQGHSRHTAPAAGSAWERLEPMTSSPPELFDGTTPVSDPWIVRDGDRLRMWYTLVLHPFSKQQTIGLATAESRDGQHWTGNKEHVLSPNREGWDAVSTETACVVRLPGGGWHLYYTAPLPPDGGHHMTIGLATSPDGVTWTKSGTGPIMTGELEWERPFRDGPDEPMIGGVLEPCVLYDAERKLFRMWYAGLGKRPGEFAKYRIGYAESADGIAWTRDPEPVFEPSPTGAWDDAITSHTHVCVAADGTHHLIYFGSSAAQYQECEDLGGCGMTPGSLGHATSPDGRTWWRTDPAPILSPSLTGWDSWAVGGPFVDEVDETLHLMYFGNGQHNSYNARFGRARLGPRQKAE